MGNNKFNELASILKVRMNTLFRVNGLCGHFKLTERGLFYRGDWSAEWEIAKSDYFNYCIIHSNYIHPYEFKPYQPKYGEDYWTVSDASWDTVKVTWMDSAEDFVRLQAGIIYSSSEDAVLDLPNKYSQLTGKEFDLNNKNRYTCCSVCSDDESRHKWIKEGKTNCPYCGGLFTSDESYKNL